MVTLQDYLLQFSGVTQEDWNREVEVLANRRNVAKYHLMMQGCSKEQIEEKLESKVKELFPHVLD